MYLANSDIWYLIIIIPILIISIIYLLKKKQPDYYTAIGNQNTLSRQITGSKLISKWEQIFFMTAILFIIFSLLRPQWGMTKEKVTKKGLDIVVALDISRSMNAEDISPSRIKKAVVELNKLLTKLNDHRVGLVTFAGSATPICPLTTDLRAIQMFLKTIKDYKEPIPGTNIENAFTTALDMFDYEAAQDRIFLVITDGENHQGDLKRIKSQANDKGIIIIPVAVGTTGGQPIPVFNENGERTGYKRDKDGEIIISHLNLEELKELATLGPYQIDNSYSTITPIAGDIKAFKVSALKELKISIYAERYQIFLMIGFLMLFISYCLNSFDGFSKKGGFNKNV